MGTSASLYNKALCSYIYLFDCKSAMGGHAAGLNGLKSFERTLEYPGNKGKKMFFFKNRIFFIPMAI